MVAEVICIKNFFKSKHVLLSADWIEGFLDWHKQEHDLPPNYTVKYLQGKVYEQWLIQDLRTIEIAALPPNLASEKSFVLSGEYCLQVIKTVDISKPKLWQLQRIRNAVSKNAEPENDFGKRVLQLTLTDGVQEVEAMEFKPIPLLNINLSPGLKIRVTGPVRVRRGIIMLENNHIKILGGQVDELSVVNAAENILARALKLPENPRPGIINENVLNTNVANEDSLSTQTVNTQNNNDPISIPKSPPRTALSGPNIIGTNMPKPNGISALINNVSNNKVSKNVPHKEALNNINCHLEFPDDDFDIDDKILLEVERKITEDEKITKPICKSPDDLFADCELDDSCFEAIHLPSTSNPKTNRLSANEENETITNHTENKRVNRLNLDEFVDIGMVKELNDSIADRSKNLINISEVLKNKFEPTAYKFLIKAKFLEVVEKFKVVDNEFQLTIKVFDTTGEILLKVHPEVISIFAECSPMDLMGYRAKVLNQDAVATDKILEVLGRIKCRLEELSSAMTVMDIELDEKGKYTLVRVRK